MSIYENGFNLDNIDSYLENERNDSLVDEFLKYSTPTRDALRESLYDSVSDYERNCY